MYTAIVRKGIATFTYQKYNVYYRKMIKCSDIDYLHIHPCDSGDGNVNLTIFKKVRDPPGVTYPYLFKDDPLLFESILNGKDYPPGDEASKTLE